MADNMSLVGIYFRRQTQGFMVDGSGNLASFEHFSKMPVFFHHLDEFFEHVLLEKILVLPIIFLKTRFFQYISLNISTVLFLFVTFNSFNKYINCKNQTFPSAK